MTISIDPTVLLNWYQAKAGVPVTSGTGTASTSVSTPATLYAPTAPWSTGAQPTESQMVTSALNGAAFVNPSAAKLNLPGASSDYKNLFALYQGVNTLYSLAEAASAKGVSSYQLKQLQTAFASGMSQVSSFVSTTSFSNLRLTTGTTGTTETSTATTPTQPTTYDTTVLNNTGDSSAVVPAFQGNVQFNVTVQSGSAGNSTVIPMDLSQMGSTPRTMSNVLSYLNGQMQAAGAITTFSANVTAVPAQTITAGGTTVTVAPASQSWGLQINTNPYESVSLSAPTTAPAVYIGQTVGNTTAQLSTANSAATPADAQSQLMKLQAGGTAITTPDPGTNAAPDQMFLDSMGNAVNSIQATATAPDGSVYVLADVNTSTSGTAAAGGQDVALMKYDSAGNLQYQTDLGSASSASGLSLAVSSDGTQVAVAGSITGPLAAGQSQLSPTTANSFVATYDSQGDQVWNQETNGLSGNQANSVAFGADGSVYVTGTTATTPDASLGQQNPSNAYLQVYSPAGKLESNTTFGGGTINTGASVAVDGSDIYVAGTQDGQAVVSEYDATDPTNPTLVATRNLGDMQGGSIAGIAVQNGTVYVAGSTQNGNLSAGAVTSAYSGGIDAFAATLSTGLAPASSDAISYYGGASDDWATAMTVSNGDVYITGSSTGALPGEAAIGAQDGFVAALNVAAGTVDYAQRFTGLDGKVAPTSIAVASTGASVLDQLGLPEGEVNAPVSNLLTATTSLKAGDKFNIAVGNQSPITITIQATDTMQSLATEIDRATGSQVKATLDTTTAGSKLEIQPLTSQTVIKLTSGPSGADALTGLGLQPGIVNDNITIGKTTKPADGGTPIYGLNILPTLNLNSASSITTAMDDLTASLSLIKGIYQNLKTAATPANVLAQQAAASSTGKVPAYLTAQIANYTAALNRLSGSTTTSTS